MKINSQYVGLLLGTFFMLLSSTAGWSTPLDRSIPNTFAPCNGCHHANAKKESVREVMCLGCHGPGGPSKLRAASHASLDCWDCHTVHANTPINVEGGQNRMNLKPSIDKTGQHSNPDTYPGASNNLELPDLGTLPENLVPVVFESRGPAHGEPSLHSFSDGDEDRNGTYDGICEACHQPYLQQTGHHIGETCTSCHPHNLGFR